MKYWILGLTLFAAPLLSAADLDDVLATVQGTTGGEEDFIPNVTWSDNPESAYYACRERLDLVTLELWVGSKTMVRAKGVPDRPLIYGTNGPVQVMSYFGEAGESTLGAYLMLPSGETHIFRVTPQQRIVKESKAWQCKSEPWREP